MSSGVGRSRTSTRRAAGRTATRAAEAGGPATEDRSEITEEDIDAGVKALAVVADSGKLDPEVQNRVAALGGKFYATVETLEHHVQTDLISP